jgi:excisionase family DNA binding protein
MPTDDRSSSPDHSSFLTVEEVLHSLKVTSRTVYRLIRTGELPAVRVGRQWRIRRVDLDTWLNRQRSSASETPVLTVAGTRDGYLERNLVPTSARAEGI